MKEENQNTLKHIILWMFLAAIIFAFYLLTAFQSLGPNIDGCTYASCARSILNGEGNLAGWAPALNYGNFHQGVIVEPMAGFGSSGSYLWALVLAFFFLILGVSDFTVAIAGGFFFIATVPFIFLATKRLFSHKAGHFACAIYIFNGALLSYTLKGMTEPLFLFLMVGAIVFALGEKKFQSSILFGIFIAAAVLTKPGGIAWALPLFLLLLKDREKIWQRISLAISVMFFILLLAQFAITPFMERQAIPQPRERAENTWTATPLTHPSLADSETDSEQDVSILVRLIARSPLKDIILVHSADFPDHSYARGLVHPDKEKVIAANISAYLHRMKINAGLIVTGLFRHLTNQLLIILGWAGILIFLFIKGKRLWSITVLSTLILGILPNLLTFAWLRYMLPALPFLIISAAGLMELVLGKIKRENVRTIFEAILIVGCCLPLGFTAGIDSLDKNPDQRPRLTKVLNKIVDYSEPNCLSARAGNKEYFDKLAKLIDDQVDQGRTLVCDVPAFAAWYGNRHTVWLPNDEKTLDQLLARVNIDYILLLFQFSRKGYADFWNKWLEEVAKNEKAEKGIKFKAGVVTKKGVIYLIRTGIKYKGDAPPEAAIVEPAKEEKSNQSPPS